MAWNPSYPSINRGIGARHGEVCRAHQMLNAAMYATHASPAVQVLALLAMRKLRKI